MGYKTPSEGRPNNFQKPNLIVKIQFKACLLTINVTKDKYSKYSIKSVTASCVVIILLFNSDYELSLCA